MKEYEIIIDDIKVKVNDEDTILTAGKKAGIIIPTLCFLKDVNEPAGCRVCVVEVEDVRNLVTACNYHVRPSLVVRTASPKVLAARKATVELLLSNHNKNCLSCNRNLNCELQRLSKTLGCNETRYEGKMSKNSIDNSSESIVRDESKCILCSRCVSVCAKWQACHAISKVKRGFETQIGCAFEKGLKHSTCVGCGQCVLVCPTNALSEKNDINRVLRMLNDKSKELVVQVAPSVRVALAEEFGHPIGTFNEGKMITSLRRLGFNHVFDVNTGADFTIVEESKELINRITKGTGPLPMFTSCCPGWYKYMELFAPEYKENISTCKSPNEMLATLVKYYFRQKEDKEVRVIAIMPCTAKKHEVIKYGEIDAVLTTRELAQLIKHKNIDYNNLPEGKFDQPFGLYSGAGLIFGATGGVMEAALRTASHHLNKTPRPVDMDVVRNSIGRKEVEIKTDSKTLKVAIINGLNNARLFLKDLKEGKTTADFVEVMACPGGCVNGGGQPIVDYSKISVGEVIKKRSKPLYINDKKSQVRTSHENEQVKKVYEDLLGNDDKLIHKLLHNK